MFDIPFAKTELEYPGSLKPTPRNVYLKKGTMSTKDKTH